jgi:hypothetical protein
MALSFFRRCFRGVVRVSLGAILGAAIAIPLRAWLHPSDRSPAQVSTGASSKPKADAAPVAPVQASKPEELPPYPTGYVLKGRMINVIMSDGTIRTERDEEMSKIERNSVMLDGKKLFFKPFVPPVLSSAVTASQVPANGPEASPTVVAGVRPDPSGWVLGDDGVYRSTKDIRAGFGQ